MMFRNLFILTLLSTLLWGCAKPPRQELEAARLSVAQAYSAGARELAPAEYEAASTALREGEALVRRGKYDRARQVLPSASESARKAEEKALEMKAALEQSRLIERQEREAAMKPKPAPAKKTPAVKKPEPPPAPEPPPPPPPPLTSYTVAAGETLWTIAARNEVYVDALLWPLLYKANRDQIKDPRQIYPGQVLNIPRELTEREKEEARETARTSDIFPIDQMGSASGTN